MEIAKYYVSVGYRFDRQEQLMVDKSLEKFGERMSTIINPKKLNKSLGDALDKASNTVVFEISKFVVNQRALQAALTNAGRRIGGELPLSRQHPQQVAQRSYTQQGGLRGLGGHFGPYALAAGATMGMTALKRGGQQIEANELALIAAAGSEQEGARYSKFLSDLGDRLGKTTKTMSPFFAQMLAGAKGTALEPHLETGFESLMEYASVMGLDDQKIKGTIRAFSQMIGKQQIMAEELRGQAAEHLPPVVRLMADVAAGGDVKKLNKMMERGELDPNVHLPLLFGRLKKESAPYMDRFFGGSRFAQGKMDKAAEDQLKVFSKSGGTEGFINFFNLMAESFKKAEPLIKALAGSFEDITKVLQAPVTLFGALNDTLTSLSQITGVAEKNFTNLAMVGALMMTKWGKVGLMFTAMLIVLEDIAIGVSGEGDSYTGRFLKWLEESGMVLGPFEKGLIGVSAALFTIAAALKAISTATSLPGVGDMLGGGGGRKGGKGSLGGLAGKLLVAGGLAAGAVGVSTMLSEEGTQAINDPLTQSIIDNNNQNQNRLLSLAVGGGMVAGVPGAAAGALYALGTPKFTSGFDRDESGARIVPAQNNDELVKALMAARAGKAGGSVSQSYNIQVHIDPETLGNLDVQKQGQALGEWFKTEIMKTQQEFTNKESH